jgi:hypothetical protein
MNRIYQGRVSHVEILSFSASDGETRTVWETARGVRRSRNPAGQASGNERVNVAQPDEGRLGKTMQRERKKGEVSKSSPWQPLGNWQDILWQHHELFQDRVLKKKQFGRVRKNKVWLFAATATDHLSSAMGKALTIQTVKYEI